MADLTQIMRRWGGRLLLALFTLLVVAPDFVQAQAAPERSQQNRLRRRVLPTRDVAAGALTQAAVSLRNNQLDINVQDQDLHDIINNIAAQGDIKISQLEGLPKKRLSLRFSNLPVVTGLKRLFRAAEVESYVLVTESQGDAVRVQRIMFFPPSDTRSRTRSNRSANRRPPAPALRPPPPEDRQSNDDEGKKSGSVFEDLKTNTAARRLLSQLVHPNEQVRERALERLVRLVDNDDKQAELLEFLEPLMEDLASEDRTEREEARQEIRKILRRN